jgi:hypothetical protein
MKNIFFFIAGILVSQLVKAQLPDYYVFLTYGDIWIQHENKSVKIKPKQLVYASDVITIKDQHSEIELVNKEGDFVVLNSKSAYKVNSLKEKLSQKTGGLTNKYLRLVWEAITHSSSDFDVYKNESVAASWGGGARGDGCSIEKYPKGRCFFSNDSLTFKWKNKDIHKTYHFQLYDSSKNIIIELLLRDTQLVLLTRSLSFGEYYWSIDPVTHPCLDIKKNKITLISKEQEDSVTTSLIKTISANKDDIFYNLQLSELLGNNGFIEKALEYFNKSWELYKQR